MTVNGTVLTMGVLPLDKVYVQLSPERKEKIPESLLPGTILNETESSGLSIDLETQSVASLYLALTTIF